MSAVGGADQRAGLDVEESERERVRLELRELHGRHEPSDGEMLLRGLEVLADREDVDPGLAEVAKRLAQLLVRLAEADHEAGLDPVATSSIAGDGGRSQQRE